MTTVFSQNQLFFQYLTQAGDGTGVKDAIGDYSAGATTWYLQPSAGETLSLDTLLISIADNGTFDGTDYGAIGGGLTNGLDILVSTGGVEQSILGGNKLKNNFQMIAFGAMAQDVNLAGDQQVLQTCCHFHADHGRPLVLFGTDRLAIVLNDDFTGLTLHRFHARGVRK